MSLLRTMGASRLQLLLHARLPSAIPQFFTGLKIAVTYSYVAAIVAEFVGAQQGLGVYMTTSKNAFRTDLVFGAVIVTALLTLLLFGVIVLLERLAMPWRRPRRGGRRMVTAAATQQARLEVRGLGKRFEARGERAGAGARRRRPGRRAGRADRADRAERLRQEHALPDPRRARRADGRRGADRRPRAGRSPRRLRLHAAARQPAAVAPHDRQRHARARARRGSAAPRRAPVPSRCSSASGSASSRARGPGSCQVACASAPRSCGRC